MDYSARLAQIQTTALNRYASYTAADKRIDHRTGTLHGQKNIPAADEPAHPFRDEILTEAHRDLSRYRAALDDFASELDKQETQLVSERDDLFKARREQAAEAFDNKLDNVEREKGERSARHSALRERYQEARRREGQLSAELGRPLRVRGRWLYPPAMLLVALAEVPINRFAFELFFGESPALSLFTAVVLGGILALMAHFLGLTLRHSQHVEGVRRKLSYVAAAVGIVVVIVPLFYVLALLREHYVSFIEQTTASFAEMLAQGGLAETAETVMQQELGTAGWTLLLLNVVIFSVGVILSFVRHDPHPDYEAVVRTREKSEKAYQKVRRGYEKSVNVIKTERDQRLDYLQKQQERLDEDIAAIDHARELLRDYRSRSSNHVALHLKQRLQVYELANRQSRLDGAVPTIFATFDEHDFQRSFGDVVVDFPGAGRRSGS